MFFAIFFFPIFLHTLGVFAAIDINTDIPSYSEYMRRLGIAKLKATTPEPIEQVAALKQQEEASLPISAFQHMPIIPLCKELPKEAGIQAHIFCWAMVALFALTVISLIIYQLRSILWLKLTLDKKVKKREQFEQIELGKLSSQLSSSTKINEQQSNYQNFNDVGADEKDLPRMLPM